MNLMTAGKVARLPGHTDGIKLARGLTERIDTNVQIIAARLRRRTQNQFTAWMNGHLSAGVLSVVNAAPRVFTSG